MSVNEDLIKEVIDRIVSISSPEKVILFGSAATGNMTSDSDIDLLVIMKEPIDSRKQGNFLARNLRGLGYPFDVIGGIAYPAHKYGRVIYEAA